MIRARSNGPGLEPLRGSTALASLDLRRAAKTPDGQPARRSLHPSVQGLLDPMITAKQMTSLFAYDIDRLHVGHQIFMNAVLWKFAKARHQTCSRCVNVMRIIEPLSGKTMLEMMVKRIRGEMSGLDSVTCRNCPHVYCDVCADVYLLDCEDCNTEMCIECCHLLDEYVCDSCHDDRLDFYRSEADSDSASSSTPSTTTEEESELSSEDSDSEDYGESDSEDYDAQASPEW